MLAPVQTKDGEEEKEEEGEKTPWQDLTRSVLDSMGPQTPTRLREVMTALIQHLHQFAREARLTMDELAVGIRFINEAGQMSDERRNESQLVCDILGLESSVALCLCSRSPLSELGIEPGH